MGHATARVLTGSAIALTVVLVGTLVACSGKETGGGATSSSGGEPPATSAANAAPPDSIRVAATSGGAVVVLEGMLPTPCHEIAWTAGSLDAEGVAPLALSVSAPTDRLCAQVLTPYRLEILGSQLPPGTRAVAVGDRIVPLTPNGPATG